MFRNKSFDFKICQLATEQRAFVSTANKPLVGTLMTIGDVTVCIAITSVTLTQTNHYFLCFPFAVTESCKKFYDVNM